MENMPIGSKIYLIGMLKVFNKASHRVKIFKTIMAENFPDLLKDTPNPGHINENEFTSGHTLVKFQDIKKNKSLRYQRENAEDPQENGGYSFSRRLLATADNRTQRSSALTALRSHYHDL